MHTEIATLYQARFAITLMGRNYAPGDEISDTRVDGKVLRRLSDNGRIILVPVVRPGPVRAAVQVNGTQPPEEDEGEDEADPEDDDAGDEPADGTDPADEFDTGDEADPEDEPEPLDFAGQAYPMTGALSVNAAWKADFAKNRADKETLKDYLQRVLQAHKLPTVGTVQQLVNRLGSEGVKPSVAGH